MLIQIYHPIEDIKFYLAVIVLLEALAVYTWQFRKIPGAMVAAVSQVFKCIWLISIVLYTTSTELSDKLFWIVALKLAGLLLSCSWVVFAWQISQQKKDMDVVTKYSLGSMLCFVILLLSNWREIIWQNAWLDGQVLVMEWGIGHVFMMGYAVLCCIIATFLSVRWVLTSVGLRRQQACWYTMAVGLSWMSYTLWRFGVRTDIIIPIGFLLNGIVVTWIYLRLQLYNILPLAKSVAIDNVVEGIFFVDKDGYIVDINACAQSMLKGLPIAIGTHIKETAAVWSVLGEVDSKPGVQVQETERKESLCSSWYQLTKIPLQNAGQPSFGRIILVKDITSQKQNQVQMIEQENALAILSERNRLGREIHDGSGQTWNYLQLEINLLDQLLADGKTNDAVMLVKKLKIILHGVHEDVRESIVSLKTDRLEKHDFITTLNTYLKWYGQTCNIIIGLTLPDQPLSNFITSKIEVQLLRIIQEALSNIRKHANATEVQINMQEEEGTFVVVISDNGCSFVPEAEVMLGHYGLDIMRERAEAAGGKLVVESAAGQGTKVKIIFDVRGSYGEG
jgi:Signal transduction histidine kinase, nitrate/nitrite-specific